MTNQSTDWIRYTQNEINQSLEELFTCYPNNVLKDAMCHAVLNGGKRIRSLIIKSVGSAFNIEKNILNQLSVAIELIHAYSLIHDDLPAMDNDDYRRGQPTCHKKFGESQAILAGDALQSLAFEVLSSDKLNIVSNNKTSIIHFFANAIGAKGMVLGQSQDMIFTDQKINIKQLSEMQLLKTGKLFELACVCPVLINSAIDNTNVKKFQKLGALIGKMYQITDDILDATISSDQLGKTSGKDQDANKQTYVTIFGIEESKKINNKIFQEIKLLISVLKRHLTQLSMLIDYIFERKF